jgi:hypothetical protein
MRIPILALLVLTACGQSPPETPKRPAPPQVTVDSARDLIADAPELSDYQFTDAAYSLPMKRSMMNEPARAAAAALIKAGWIKFDGDEVVLSAKAAGDRRFIVRPNGFVDIVPLARKEFLGVTGVRTAPDGAPLVDFEWQWKPNEIGQVFAPKYDGLRRATATLLWDGKSWIVLRIEKRE